MEFQTRPEKTIYKYEPSFTENICDFTTMINDLLECCHDCPHLILDYFGLSLWDVENANFTEKQFREILNFYLKEKSRC